MAISCWSWLGVLICVTLVLLRTSVRSLAGATARLTQYTIAAMLVKAAPATTSDMYVCVESFVACVRTFPKLSHKVDDYLHTIDGARAIDADQH